MHFDQKTPRLTPLKYIKTSGKTVLEGRYSVNLRTFEDTPGFLNLGTVDIWAR